MLFFMYLLRYMQTFSYHKQSNSSEGRKNDLISGIDERNSEVMSDWYN